MSIESGQARMFGGELGIISSISVLVEKAHKSRGSYLITQSILNSLERVICTNAIDEPPTQELLDAWDEIAAIVQEDKKAYFGPNLEGTN
jgi:hypothetical protein